VEKDNTFQHRIRSSRPRVARWLWAAAAFCAALTLPASAALSNTAPDITVAASDAAAAADTWMTFGLDHVPWLKMQVFGNPLWHYLALLIFIVLAFYVSKLLDYIIQVQLRRWATRTATKFDDLVLELLHGPVKIVCFVLLLHLGLQVFAWSPWVATLISRGLTIVVAFSLTYVAVKFVDLVMGLWQQRVESAQEGVLDMHLFPIIRKTLKVFVIIVGVLVTSQNLGLNINSLLASLSIGGLAVGLAAQDTLSNLFGAVAILADKPFRVGDHIQLDSIEGKVETIGLRSTRVRNLDGFLVTIPNKTMASSNIVNVSKRPSIKTVINLGVTYDTPADGVERAVKIIEEVFRPHPRTADLVVSFNKFDSSALNIQLVHWWNGTDLKAYSLGLQNLNLELKRRFDREKINLAFPSQTVYLRQDSEWRVAQMAGGAAADGPAT